MNDSNKSYPKYAAGDEMDKLNSHEENNFEKEDRYIIIKGKKKANIHITWGDIVFIIAILIFGIIFTCIKYMK